MTEDEQGSDIDDRVNEFILYLSKRFPDCQTCSRNEARVALLVKGSVGLPLDSEWDKGDEEGHKESWEEVDRKLDNFLIYISKRCPERCVPSRKDAQKALELENV